VALSGSREHKGLVLECLPCAPLRPYPLRHWLRSWSGLLRSCCGPSSCRCCQASVQPLQPPRTVLQRAPLARQPRWANGSGAPLFLSYLLKKREIKRREEGSLRGSASFPCFPFD
jgi:hypothetical protein